jgi:hypothetical protein
MEELVALHDRVLHGIDHQLMRLADERGTPERG